MFSKTMRAGEAVEIGDVVAIRVEHKSGTAVRLAFFTALPIRNLVDGLVPPKYILGISCGPRRVLETVQRVA